MTGPNEENPPPNEDEAPSTPAETKAEEPDQRAIANLPPVLPRIDDPERSPNGAPAAVWDENFPEELYHADRAAVSSTAVKKIITDTPAHFYDAWSQPYDADEDDSSEALRLGKLLHLALLQPKLYAERVVLAQKFDRRTKEGKAAAIVFEKSLPDKAIVVEKEEKAKIEAMALSVLAHPVAGDVLRSRHLRTELTGYYTDPRTGIRCRVRLDAYEVTPDGARTILDLKSIFRARLEDIKRAIENFKYANQAVTYIKAACIIDKLIDPRTLTAPNAPIYAWVFIEKSPPYVCRVFYPDDEMLADAEDDHNAAMTTLATCIKTNNWPAYDLSAQPIARAAWARKRENR